MKKVTISKKSKTILFFSSLFVIAIVLISFLFLYFNKTQTTIQPNQLEDFHLQENGYYFNVFTEDTKGKETTGVFENITNDTIFYASIQNQGKSREMKLTAYIDYKEIPITILSDEHKDSYIKIKDTDNVIIPFKINYDIKDEQNYKFLISLYYATDSTASKSNLLSSEYAISYDYLIKNRQDNKYTFIEEEKANYTLVDFNYPSVSLNTDFDSSSTNGTELPPVEITAKPGEKFELAYRVGDNGEADKQLLMVTIDYRQAKINNSNHLLIDTQDNKTCYGTISLEAPSQKGLYEICALIVPDPELPTPFVPLNNAYRFTLKVE